MNQFYHGTRRMGTCMTYAVDTLSLTRPRRKWRWKITQVSYCVACSCIGPGPGPEVLYFRDSFWLQAEWIFISCN